MDTVAANITILNGDPIYPVIIGSLNIIVLDVNILGLIKLYRLMSDITTCAPPRRRSVERVAAQ